MSDYRFFQTHTATRTMTVLFDNLFNESDLEAIEAVSGLLSQQEIETLTEEEFSYFLAHGSLDSDSEVY